MENSEELIKPKLRNSDNISAMNIMITENDDDIQESLPVNPLNLVGDNSPGLVLRDKKDTKDNDEDFLFVQKRDERLITSDP